MHDNGELFWARDERDRERLHWLHLQLPESVVRADLFLVPEQLQCISRLRHVRVGTQLHHLLHRGGLQRTRHVSQLSQQQLSVQLREQMDWLPVQ